MGSLNSSRTLLASQKKRAWGVSPMPSGSGEPALEGQADAGRSLVDVLSLEHGPTYDAGVVQRVADEENRADQVERDVRRETIRQPGVPFVPEIPFGAAGAGGGEAGDGRDG